MPLSHKTFVNSREGKKQQCTSSGRAPGEAQNDTYDSTKYAFSDNYTDRITSEHPILHQHMPNGSRRGNEIGEHWSAQKIG